MSLPVEEGAAIHARKRAPTTFALVLALIALALLLALTITGILMTRTGLRTVSVNYAQLVVATALAADDLAARADATSLHTLAALEKTGLAFTQRAPPANTRSGVPMVAAIARAAARQMDGPDDVRIAPAPDTRIWIRSPHDPDRWIVLRAVSYRRQLLDWTLTVMLLAGLIALAIATLGARLLTRPLERLTTHAGALLAGDPMIQQQLRGSPREVRQLAEAIGAAGQQLHHAAQERELMLAGISHDLRTPLTRLRLALELGDADDPQRREAMVADLEELDGALEQSLAFVRDGRDEALREVDIVTLLGQLLALRRQPDDWQLDGPAMLPLRVRPTLLRRAIGNLMDNAERYGDPPFALSLACHGDWLQLCIADHGPGVPEPLLSQLGRPFLRGDPARGGGGSGLGLSIVRRAAELHGGKLQLENRDCGGLLATLRLPTRR